MTDEAKAAVSKAPKAKDEASEDESGPSEATAKKQARMDKDRAARKPRGLVTQTTDNAFRGAGVLAAEKAAARKARTGK